MKFLKRKGLLNLIVCLLLTLDTLGNSIYHYVKGNTEFSSLWSSILLLYIIVLLFPAIEEFAEGKEEIYQEEDIPR